MNAWHGVTVDRDVIEAPDRMTVGMIDKESNAERRRVMVERFGADRMVREGGAELIDADATGKLWLRKMPWGDYWQREPVVVVEVENSTPRGRWLAQDLLPSGAADYEDGTRRRRLDLRDARGAIPPPMSRARSASIAGRALIRYVSLGVPVDVDGGAGIAGAGRCNRMTSGSAGSYATKKRSPSDNRAVSTMRSGSVTWLLA